MGCLQKGHWSQFYLRKRIFRTLFVSRVLSLKVMVRPGNTILVLNIFFCLLACISLFVFLFFLELRRRAACHFIKIEKKVHREGESPQTKYQTHPHTYKTLHTQNKERPDHRAPNLRWCYKRPGKQLFELRSSRNYKTHLQYSHNICLCYQSMFLGDVCARLSGSTYRRVIALINWYEKENDERRGTTADCSFIQTCKGCMYMR